MNDPNYYCGSDDRNLQSGPPPAPQSAFWAAFKLAQRWHAVTPFLDTYREHPSFAALVLKAELINAVRREES
jgi:hypothetical protein